MWVQEAIEKVREKMSRVSRKNSAGIPYTKKNIRILQKYRTVLHPATMACIILPCVMQIISLSKHFTSLGEMTETCGK